MWGPQFEGSNHVGPRVCQVDAPLASDAPWGIWSLRESAFWGNQMGNGIFSRNGVPFVLTNGLYDATHMTIPQCAVRWCKLECIRTR